MKFICSIAAKRVILKLIAISQIIEITEGKLLKLFPWKEILPAIPGFISF